MKTNQTRTINRLQVAGMVLVLIGMCSCAFDVSHARQKPAVFTSVTETTSFMLLKEVKAKLGTGFPTILKTNTIWRQIGATESGQVYSTKDQVVKVEASNIYEAYIIVSNVSLVGFYLPVEKTSVPLARPLPMETKNQP